MIHEKIGLLPFNEAKLRETVSWIMQQKYEAWTISGYKLFLRKFWIFEHGDDLPKEVRQLLRVKRPKDNGKVSEDMITDDEIAKLIAACRNTRDKTIIQVLYDSGIRAGELFNLKIKDVAFKEDRVQLKVFGKTGARTVIVLGDSTHALKEYLNVHPGGEWLFPELVNKDQMTAASLAKVLNTTSKRAGIRHVYPHLFRHTRATILARSVAEAPLESQMGWVHGSNMTRTYVHLSLKDQESAIVSAYKPGEVKHEVKIEIPIPKTCPRCNTENSTGSKFCHVCGMNLSEKEVIESETDINVLKAEVESAKKSLRTGLRTVNQRMEEIEAMKNALEMSTRQLEQSTKLILDLKKENARLRAIRPK